jgi:hypothetical protein
VGTAAGGIEGLVHDSAFVRFVAAHLANESFKLIDVGCAGGLALGWRTFGDRLAAIGFDVDAPEIDRLTGEETNPQVHYVAGWVGLHEDHPLRRRIGGKAYWHHWPRGRMAYERTFAARNRPPEAASRSPDAYILEEVLGQTWLTTPLGGVYDTDYAAAFEVFAAADHASGGGTVIALAPHLKAAGFYDADFLKLDIDGPDYEVLRSLTELLAQPSLLGVGLEVSFFGSHDANDNSFHNVDRLMREKGFDLFALSVRTYSSAALPFPYVSADPAQNAGGRAGQGDAIYVRDLGSRVRAEVAEGLSDERLAKAAAIFALSGMPDYAAEILVAHRMRLSRLFDVDEGLDLLTRDIQVRGEIAPDYAGYIAAFEADDPGFFNYGVAAREAQAAEAARIWNEAQAALGAAIAARDAAQSDLAASEARLAAICGSTSWRLTSAVRWLGARLRGRRVKTV